MGDDSLELAVSTLSMLATDAQLTADARVRFIKSFMNARHN